MVESLKNPAVRLFSRARMKNNIIKNEPGGQKKLDVSLCISRELEPGAYFLIKLL